jgi:hypothetical protein
MRIVLLLLLSTSAFAAPPASDIPQRLARWKQVQMPYDSAGLDARQRQMIDKLVQASRQLELIYWRQSDPEGLALYRSTKDTQLKRLLAINGGRFDLIDNNHPFAGSKPIAPGRNLYPEALTRQQIEAYVQAHPSEKEAIYNPYTRFRTTPTISSSSIPPPASCAKPPP